MNLKDLLKDSLVTQNGTNYTCNICNAACTGEKQIQDHITGKSHKKKTAIKLQSSSFVAEVTKVDELHDAIKEGTLIKGTDLQTPYRCKCCDVDLNGETPARDHLKSSKHKKKSSFQDIPSNDFATRSYSKNHELHSNASLKQLIGTSMKQYTAKEDIESHELQNAIEEGTLIACSDLQTPYRCKYCDVGLNGETPARDHLNSSKHKKKLSQCPVFDDNSNEWTKISADKHRKSDEYIYKNTSNPRGGVFIFNNTFANCDKKSYREGAKKDSDNLKVLFRKMGYEVFVYEDYTFEETLIKLSLIQKNREVDLNNYDSLTIFLLSHGENDNFLSVDKKEISLQEILRMFRNDQCHYFMNKPKFFFVNFCRGSNEESDGMLTKDSIGRGQTTAMKDTCVFFASQKDFAALRDPSKGTIFIQSVFEVLSSEAYSMHIEDLWKKIVRTMQNKNGTTGEYRNLGFVKRFYFNPVCQRL